MSGSFQPRPMEVPPSAHSSPRSKVSLTDNSDKNIMTQTLPTMSAQEDAQTASPQSQSEPLNPRTLSNRSSNPIITTEEDDGEILDILNAVSDAILLPDGEHAAVLPIVNGHPPDDHRDIINSSLISKPASVDPPLHTNSSPPNNETAIIETTPIRKTNSSVQFQQGPPTHRDKQPSIDFDSTQHKKRGTGVLASTADLSTSPERFAMGCTLLQLCAIGDLSKVQSYVVNSFDNVDFRDYDRRTGLHVAASEGHLDVVRFLIGRGARVNRTDRWGGSPLDDAHRHRHGEVARFLRDKGGKSGSLNLTSNLINAAAVGDIEEVKVILSSMDYSTTLDLSKSRNSKRGSYVYSALPSKGRRSPDLDVSEPKALANDECALDINKGDYDKRTALHLASSEGHYDVVDFLCKSGAHVNVMDRWGGKPLDDALQKGNDTVATLLRNYGATSAVDSSHVSSRHLSQDLVQTSHQVSTNSREQDDENLRVGFDELEMIERIGSGAFGEIYKCRWHGILVAAKCIKASKIQKEWLLKNRIGMDRSSDRIANRIEAIKQASITEEEKQLALEDFRRETAIMRRLRHPNIVMMLGYSNSEELEVMISELMKCSLLDIFKANHISNSQLPKRTQVIYAQQLAQGMNHLHKSRPPIIHRDLKPANLLIDFNGTLKIADFGLAKIRPNPEHNEQEAFMMTGETGSYRFMAPEVFRHEEYTESVDVYSYAMIFYYMLRGISPWAGLSGIEAATKAAVDGERPLIPRDVDARLASLLKTCWDEDPKARPSFDDIIRSLSIYSHDVFQTDDREVPLAKEDTSCGCVIS